MFDGIINTSLKLINFVRTYNFCATRRTKYCWSTSYLMLESTGTLGWITYRFSYALRHNDAKNMTLPRPPAICVISRFSGKSIVFQKNFLNVLTMKIYTTNIQTAPDYSSTTAIMLVIFWIEHDFCIIYDCKNSFNKKLKNYLKNPSRKNVKTFIGCVPFSLGSICQYWIYVIDDIGVIATLSNI